MGIATVPPDRANVLPAEGRSASSGAGPRFVGDA
jgi:hypothetical protein